MALKVTVSASDIALGLRRDAERCPVALAIFRAKGPALVTGKSVVMGRKGQGRHFRLPARVTRRIDRYDDTGQMNPFTFELA